MRKTNNHYNQVCNSAELNIITAENDIALDFPLSISQLANAGETTVHTVRNYLTEGLLGCCEQTSSGHGRFDQCALNRLRLIRAARLAGLLIIDIKPLLEALKSRPGVRNKALKDLYHKIEEKQTHLHLLNHQLTELDKLS